jgi:DinB family protein
MRYTNLPDTDRDALLDALRDMPAWLAGVMRGLSSEETVRRAPGGGFAPVEQCWHLAELERDAFALRLRRLRAEDRPVLPDFDGEKAAVEGNYLGRSCAEGVAAFAAARRANLDLIASIRADEWDRAGRQEGVGDVMLCDLPAMMAEHDASHRREIEEWLGREKSSGEQETSL